VILSALTTSSIAHMSTANRMSAILQECGAMNNARTVDEAFRPSKRTLRAAKKPAASLGFFRQIAVISLIREGTHSIDTAKQSSPASVSLFQRFGFIHGREALRFMTVNCAACGAPLP
jgi:hypothetical protein